MQCTYIMVIKVVSLYLTYHSCTRMTNRSSIDLHQGLTWHHNMLGQYLQNNYLLVLWMIKYEFNQIKDFIQYQTQHTTRQSEMANTSPATCQCLATFTPLKSKMLIFFSWRHFSARSSCYIINRYGYPRGSHEKYLKEIVCPVFEIRYWIVTC